MTIFTQKLALEAIFHNINYHFFFSLISTSLVLLRVMNAQYLGNEVTNMTSFTEHDKICHVFYDNFPYAFCFRMYHTF